MIETKGGMMKYQTHTRQEGAVSMFVVIFTALLFVAVSVGFTVLMTRGQGQTTDADLAQSALDSAYAGTEDAKRVLAQYADCQERNTLNSADALPVDKATCEQVVKAIESPSGNKCETINRALGDNPGERLVRQNEADEKLLQAYTCVKITPDTDSYVGKVRSESEGEVRVIPLRATGQFDRVKVRWLKRDDMSLATGTDPDFSIPTKDTTQPAGFLKLPTKGEWLGANRGALLRVGTIQYQPGAIDVTKMDEEARAVFLYSSQVGIDTVASPIKINEKDLHRPLPPANQDGLAAEVTPNQPVPASCSTNREEYACETYLELPSSDNHDLFRYLTISSIYRDVSFEVSLIDSHKPPVDGRIQPTRFKNVQPEIDATARANNKFRRVVSRVESADANQAPYPRAAVGTGGSICKNFVVTDDPDDFRDYAHTDAPTLCASVDNPNGTSNP